MDNEESLFLKKYLYYLPDEIYEDIFVAIPVQSILLRFNMFQTPWIEYESEMSDSSMGEQEDQRNGPIALRVAARNAPIPAVIVQPDVGDAIQGQGNPPDQYAPLRERRDEENLREEQDAEAIQDEGPRDAINEIQADPIVSNFINECIFIIKVNTCLR